MKKLLFSTFAFCAFATSTFAQTLTVPDVEVKPGDKAVFVCNVNVDNKDYKAVSFTMNFPKTGFTLTKANVLSSWEGGNKGIGTLDENGQANGTFFNTNAQPMPYGDIEIGSIEFQAASDLEVGTEYDVTLTAVQFATMDNKGVDIADVPFKIKVVSAYSVTLDEEATEAPKAAEGVNVTVKRTIAANTWSTLCLPFAMTEAQVKDAFGDGTILGNLKEWASETDDKDAVTAIVVQFESVSAIEANHPYVINAAKEVKEFTVKGVDVDPDDPSYSIGKKSKGTLASVTGTYVAGTEVPEEALFLNGGKFWYSKGSSKPMKAFRAYFEFQDVLAAYEEAASRINITFDDITGIKSLKTDGEEEVYTLSGQRVNKAGKGVYIVNGKKVIKK
jgi:hypothetical protein